MLHEFDRVTSRHSHKLRISSRDGWHFRRFSPQRFNRVLGQMSIPAGLGRTSRLHQRHHIPKFRKPSEGFLPKKRGHASRGMRHWGHQRAGFRCGGGGFVVSGRGRIAAVHLFFNSHVLLRQQQQKTSAYGWRARIEDPGNAIVFVIEAEQNAKPTKGDNLTINRDQTTSLLEQLV